MGNSQDVSPKKTPRRHVLRTQNNDGKPRNAIVIGATGATGKFILSQLILSPEWNKVTIIHRRKVDLDEIAKKCELSEFGDDLKAKVNENVVDMTELCSSEENINENVKLFQGHDVVFCVIGTTRGIAKSADNFRKVDFDIVRDCGILARKANVTHFSLLTSKGASAGMWCNDWKISHGLLYLQIKGMAENEIIKQKFTRTSIFRPGMLARDGDTSGMLSRLDVRDLAACMVYDSECNDHSSDSDEKEEKQEITEKPVIYESDMIDMLSKLAIENQNMCFPK